MKINFKKIFNLLLVLVFALLLAGCGGKKPTEPNEPDDGPGTEQPDDGPGTEQPDDGPGTEQPEQPTFDESKYVMYGEYEFETEVSLSEAKQQLAAAQEALSTKKAYSYSVKLEGSYDDVYSYEGITKIDVTGEMPKASLELTGDENFAFYITEGKAYLNYDGDKSSFDATGDLSDLLEDAYLSIGTFVKFDSENITEDTLDFAGTDEFGATVIQYTLEEKTVTIVLYEGAIQKVLYYDMENIEYTAVYSYEAVSIVFPDDLSSYIK